MRKPLAIGLLIAVAALLAAFLYLKDRRYEVVITQEQVDTAVAPRFPAMRRYLAVLTLTCSNPEVRLLEADNRVRVGLDAELSLRLDGEARKLGGRITLTTGLRYDSEAQVFYLDDARVEDLDIAGLPEDWLAKTRELATLLAQKYLLTTPVYKVQARDAKAAVARMLLEDFRIRDQAIHVTLGL